MNLMLHSTCHTETSTSLRCSIDRRNQGSILRVNLEGNEGCGEIFGHRCCDVKTKQFFYWLGNYKGQLQQNPWFNYSLDYSD
ncbi:hypothetical protein NMG60_11014379 [Bertholletia excelsa]